MSESINFGGCLIFGLIERCEITCALSPILNKQTNKGRRKQAIEKFRLLQKFKDDDAYRKCVCKTVE